MVLSTFCNQALLLFGVIAAGSSSMLCSGFSDAAWSSTRTTGLGTRIQLLPPPLPIWSSSSIFIPVSSIASTRLFNIPPPSETDVVAFQAYASKQPPPSSFYELQQDCTRAARIAIDEHQLKLLEIEFPPLPANVLEMDDVSAYDVAQANLQLALDFSKGLLNACDSVSNIAILFPDEAEVNMAVEKVTAGGTRHPFPGITISSLRAPDANDTRIIKPEQFLLNLFGSTNARGGVKTTVPNADVYICLTASAQELPDIEELVATLDPTKVVICYNLKLDVLRGDLGAPAFPSRELHDRFLSKIKPVYYLRTRQYSRTTSTPPFVVNYQGCLFRCYPGEYQTLLDIGNGRYRRLLSSPVRPALGAFKEQLTSELKKQGVIAEENSNALNFLRTGYKTTTWWEEDRSQADDGWKT